MFNNFCKDSTNIDYVVTAYVCIYTEYHLYTT